jgi:hypothetical protein
LVAINAERCCNFADRDIPIRQQFASVRELLAAEFGFAPAVAGPRARAAASPAWVRCGRSHGLGADAEVSAAGRGRRAGHRQRGGPRPVRRRGQTGRSASQQVIRRLAAILIRARPPFGHPHPPALPQRQPRTPQTRRVDLKRLRRLGPRLSP